MELYPGGTAHTLTFTPYLTDGTIGVPQVFNFTIIRFP
jgi:hypothetical protein